MQHATDVKLNLEGLHALCASLSKETTASLYSGWKDCHYDHTARPLEELVAYICVIDSLNFCFWPSPGFEYEHLAGNLASLLSS